MDNVTNLAGACFVVLATVVVVTLGFMQMRSHNDSSRAVLQEQQKTDADMSNSRYLQYDEKTVTGDAVVLAVRQYQDTLTITVDTTVFPGDYQPQVSNPSKDGYIDVGANYASELVYNDNGYVEGITFRRI